MAILHFNENLHREKKQTKDGLTYMSVTYPKYKFGEEVVREIAVPPTYGNYSNSKGVMEIIKHCCH